jgi:superfamily II DNA or RNA helicase
MTTFLFKTQPYAHQREALEASANREAYALLMSMRTGKSKVIIDTATHLYGRGKINALVVVAPKGVHRNWLVNEVPDHLPAEVNHLAAFWQGLSTKTQQRSWEHLFTPDSVPLRVIAFNYDAIIHPRGKAQLKRALTTFRCLLVADESHRLKTPTAQRTKVMLAAAKHAPYRRILTGTFLTQGPLDAYAQLRFLDPTISGFSTYTSFRRHYAVLNVKLLAPGRAKLETHLRRQGIDPGMIDVAAFASDSSLRAAGCRPGRDYFEEVTDYQRLSELHAAVAPHATIVRAQDCVDLPPKVYKRVYVELSPEQRRIYRELLKQSVAELTASGAKPPAGLEAEEIILWCLEERDKVRADNALTKLLRLQQVVGGYATTEEGDVQPLASNRLTALLETLGDLDGKALIWARFRPELEAIYKALREQHGPAAVVRYYGGVGDEERAEAVWRLDRDPTCRFLVGNPQSGGIGLPLHAADAMVYYSKDFNLETYLQSEERASKVGKTSNVLIIDLVATDTVDEKVHEALAIKRQGAGEFYDGVLEVQGG